MNTSTLALALLCMLATTAFAQDHSSFTAPHPEGPKLRGTVVDVRTDGSYLLHRKSGNSTILREYGPDHQLRHETKDKYRVDKSPFVAESFVRAGDRHFGVAFHYDRRSDRTTLYAGEVTPRGIVDLRRRYTIAGELEALTLAPEGRQPVGFGELSANAHHGQVLLTDTRRTTGNLLAVTVFDSGFVYRWQRSVPLTPEGHAARLLEQHLGDDGVVYALADGYRATDPRNKAVATTHVLAITEAGHRDASIRLGEGRTVLEARLTLTGHATAPLVVSGVYATAGSDGTPVGTFHLQLADDLSVLSSAATPFDEAPDATADVSFGSRSLLVVQLALLAIAK